MEGQWVLLEGHHPPMPPVAMGLYPYSGELIFQGLGTDNFESGLIVLGGGAVRI